MNDEATLDPDVARYIQRVANRPQLSFDASGISALRRRYRIPQDADKLPLIELNEVRTDHIAGRSGPIPLRRYMPAKFGSDPGAAILFFHGGGWVAGDLDSHDDICRHMAQLSGLQVVSVDYRIAPEHRFPAAVEDAIDSYAMLLARAPEWNIDPRRIAVMGDGTGGTLAGVVSIHAREMCHPIPVAQILFYPATDLAAETLSFRTTPTDGVPYFANALRWLHRVYLPDGADRADWRASPLRAQSLTSMPPTFIAVGDRDPLHDEALAFAERLYKAGTTVDLRVLPGQIHGYLSIGGTIGEAARSLDAAASFLKRSLMDCCPPPVNRWS